MKLIPRERFKKIINEKTIDLFTLKNNNGCVTQITNYGGRVVNFWIKDTCQNYLDIVLGHDAIDGYLNATEAYFGAIIGRYGNRIAKVNLLLTIISTSLITTKERTNCMAVIKGFIMQSGRPSNFLIQH